MNNSSPTREENMKLSRRSALACIALTSASMLAMTTFAAQAGTLMDRIESGEAIRLGFANEAPWAFPGKNGEPLGFANAIALGVLKSMGHEKIEPVVTSWGAFIPGLQARRFDIITGGMYILKDRCENIAFSEPIGNFGNAFLVPKGNPKNLRTYRDIKEQQATMVTGAGYNTIGEAKKEGVDDSHIMQVPGPTEMIAAVRAGRADAAALAYFGASEAVAMSRGELEVTDPSAMPDWTHNWAGIGFRTEDSDFLVTFNKALKEYLGSEKMLEDVREYGYTAAQLPGNVSTKWICQNR
ncbi:MULTISPECIES: ectoine/hydroxyectoine ABC transporter substrate-binding protein EhuB [unclassified Mesorhizobium]|uniref:ectoine/hydroxyectoine ABC transporter substrate-binding protein EhuB n=1 Tax=unclassified Mesorhizobium TaxID=325217 RepID=UPI001FDF1234|nr:MULTISPECIES: ectoine/hydroxyectoine ABC transporter substrate-binding protein EhuB [unclassified Mesorhizobium]